MLSALDVFARLTLQRNATQAAGSNTEIRRILVIELWNIGDVVLAMPFLAQLRALFPAARVTLLARPHARDVLAGTGLVDEFVDTELGWSESSGRRNPFHYNWRELARVRRELKRREFDVAFSSRLHVREHVVLALSGAKRRVAFALGGHNGVLTDPIQFGNPNRHKVEDWTRLLQPFGGAVASVETRLEVSEAERRWAETFLAQRGASTENRLVAIHPGASVPSKRWPMQRFVEVAESSARMSDVNVLAFVAPDGYGAELARVPGVIGAKVDLRQLVSLLERCDVLICNDSGPMHIAGALGVPTVSVFGSGIERWFSPLGAGHRLLTVNSNSSSSNSANTVKPYDIAGISTSQVLDALKEVLTRN
jgi:ADP-heptose:LPS heptosyltransferase